MNDYENAVATKMLASHCGICGKALVDALSVERGVGPECYSHLECDTVSVSEDTRKEANRIVYKAALAAQAGEITQVLVFAKALADMGLKGLADKVAHRFRNAERYTEIVITLENDMYRVETPFRRGKKDDFIAAWRAIPGRRFVRSANYVPKAQKKALFEVLKRFFSGKIAKGPKGLFRIPAPEFKAEQGELALKVA